LENAEKIGQTETVTNVELLYIDSESIRAMVNCYSDTQEKMDWAFVRHMGY